MIPDVPPPGERWCRVCHRLERDVRFYLHDATICVDCRLLHNAYCRYWRIWEWERRQARNQARGLAA